MFNGFNQRVQYGNHVHRYGYGFGRKRGQYRRRAMIPRQYVPSKMTKAEVSKIAKKVVTKHVETKMFANGVNQGLTNGAFYVTNLANGLTQNISSAGHVGRRIDLQAIRLRVRFAVNAGGATAPSGALYRVLVFKTSQQLTTTTSAAVTQSLILRTPASSFDPLAFPDTDSIDVIMDYTGVINPNTTSATEGDIDFFSQDIPFKRRLEFLDETSSYFKQDNYYVYFAMGRDDGSIVNAGTVNLGWQLQYTNA